MVICLVGGRQTWTHSDSQVQIIQEKWSW